jgi:serine/threonine protein kinase
VIRPGARVGDFELVARLGSGGQGLVYLARPWDGTPLRPVAHHWLRHAHRLGALRAPRAARWRLAALKLARPGAVASLHDEHGYLAAPGWAHPHLVSLFATDGAACGRVFGLLADAGCPAYLALRYLPGVSLERLLAARGPLDEPRALAIGLQLAGALAHLHRRGLVHHDVRPANVIVGRRGGRPHATLIDLGAAETPGRPRRRGVYGTPGHLPPERLGATPAAASPLVDIYGLGVLLQTVAPRPATPALRALIADATAPDPVQRAARLPTMAALQERLAALQRSFENASIAA